MLLAAPKKSIFAPNYRLLPPGRRDPHVRMLPEKVRSACTVSDRYDNAPCPPATRTPTRTPRCNTETRPHTITVAVNAALNPLRRVTDRTSCAHKRPSHTTSRASTSPRDPRTTPQRGFQVCFSIKVCFGFLFFRRVLDQVHLKVSMVANLLCVQRNVCVININGGRG